jgi:hypothetical protein
MVKRNRASGDNEGDTLAVLPGRAVEVRPSATTPEEAANRVNDGTLSPLEAAKVIRKSRLEPNFGNGLALLLGGPGDQTRALVNLEDEPFRIVEAGHVPPAYAAMVGYYLPHDKDKGRRLPGNEGKQQLEMLELLASSNPKDEAEAASIVRDALNDRADKEGRGQKLRCARRLWPQRIWGVGTALSWIAYQDEDLICDDWKGGPTSPIRKVDDPGKELMTALKDENEDTRLRAEHSDPDRDYYPSKFWRDKTISDVFALKTEFPREHLLKRWPLTQPPLGEGMQATVEAPDNSKATTVSPITNGWEQPRTTNQLAEIAERVLDEVATEHKKKTGIAPNVRRHATEAMERLAQRYPRNHATRAEVEKIAKTKYKCERAESGETHARALKRMSRARPTREH